MSPARTYDRTAERQGGLFTLLILTIFSTEIVLEGLFAPIFARVKLFSWGTLDALLLTLLFIPPLWFFFVRPLYGSAEGKEEGLVPARYLLLQSLGVIFAVEFFVMLLLPVALPGLPERLHNFLDALSTTVACAPFLYFLFFRKKVRECRAESLELLETPLRLYIVLLLMVFLLTLLQEMISPLFLPFLPRQWNVLFESLLVTVLFAPVLFFLVVRPLSRLALTERARVSALCSEVIDAVMTVDEAGAIKSVNPAAERIFGYRCAEIMGGCADLLFKGGRECLSSLLVGAAPAGKGGSRSHELVATCRDGGLLTVDTSVSRVRMSEREEFLLIMRDVSERHRMQRELQESEERFRQIFHQSDDAIIFFDPQSCAIVDLNGTAESLYGCGREALREGGIEGLVCADELPAVTALIRGCHNGSSALDCVLHRRADGTELFLSVRGKLMALPGALLVYCTFRDITARVRLEEEAREMQSRLIHMNKMASLGLVVSGVAHEVNNPNNFIMASTELLARAWKEALPILQEHREAHGEFPLGGIPFDAMACHIPELCAGALDGSRRINEIINNLKSFARQDGSSVMKRVDLNTVVQGAVAILQYELVKHTEKFRLELGRDLPPVQGNPQQLGQVTVNLLMNACQALSSRASGIWLTTAFDEAAGEVTITVRDEGCGIPQEERGKVMAPFFSTKLDRGGTGLGLSICRSIVKEHQGALEFQSEPGEGTTFVVRLPATPCRCTAQKGSSGGPA